MNALTETISLQRWQLFALLGMAGFAIGNILAKLTTALGF